MTFEFSHNFLRKLMNLEWEQLPFLNEKQKDGFFANPHTFFIRADDETAQAIWDVLYPNPKPPEAKSGVVVDLDRYRRAFEGGPVIPLRWSPEVRIGGLPPMQERKHGCPPDPSAFEFGTSADVPPRTYLVN